jgi:outer membrane protein assembly factor BamB
VLEGGEVYCLNRDNGEKHWQKVFNLGSFGESSQNLSQISLNQYRQLDESLFLIQEDSRVSLGLIRTGEILSFYDAGQPIDSISSYDLLDKCVYLTQTGKITRLNLKVM